MKNAIRVSPRLASSLLVLVAVLSALLLVFSRSSSNPLVQVITMLVSMGLVFYASHPLGHYFVARAYGVGTEYFFLGRSDFRKLRLKPMSSVGALMPTIGTKLKKGELASLPPRKRGRVFGAGVIVSNALIGIQLAYVLGGRFQRPRRPPRHAVLPRDGGHRAHVQHEGGRSGQDEEGIRERGSWQRRRWSLAAELLLRVLGLLGDGDLVRLDA